MTKTSRFGGSYNAIEFTNRGVKTYWCKNKHPQGKEVVFDRFKIKYRKNSVKHIKISVYKCRVCGREHSKAELGIKVKK